MAYINGIKTFFGGVPRTSGVKWAGLYSASRLYPKGSIAAYQGSVYLKVSTASAGTAPTDTSAWKFLGKAVSGSKTLYVNGKHNVAGAEYVDVQTATVDSWEGIFSNSESYLVSDVVYYNGGIYKCLEPNGTLPTDTASWEHLGDVVTGNHNIYSNGTHDVTNYKTIHVAVPDENNWEGNYEEGVAYKYGALVVYKNAVYLALADTDGTISPDNEEYWAKLNVILDTWDGTGVVIAPIEEEPTTDELAGTWVFNQSIISTGSFSAVNKNAIREGIGTTYYVDYDGNIVSDIIYNIKNVTNNGDDGVGIVSPPPNSYYNKAFFGTYIMNQAMRHDFTGQNIFEFDSTQSQYDSLNSIVITLSNEDIRGADGLLTFLKANATKQ